MHSELQEHVQREARSVAPGSGAMDRVHDRLRAHVDGLSDEHVEAASRPGGSSRRRRPLRLGLAVAGAVGIAVLVALAPSIGGDDDVSVAPTSAAAALRSAGAAAGEATWSPIAPGEYHHVATRTFVTDRDGTTGKRTGNVPDGSGALGVELEEWWLTGDARGLGVRSSSGSGDATHFPRVGRSPRTGEPSSLSWSLPLADRSNEEAADALEFADSVMTWRRNDASLDFAFQSWFRVPSGYESTRPQAWSSRDLPGRTATERAQIDRWGMTIDEVRELDDAAPDDREDVVLALLDQRVAEPARYDDRALASGRLGVRDQAARREWRITQAVKLLGTAPLSPAVRRTIFLWLSRQPGATLQGAVRDQLDRPGVGISFAAVSDVDVPRTTMTAAEVRRLSGQPATRRFEGDGEDVEIPAHTEQRRWYLDVIIDPDTGELLEQDGFSRWQTDGLLPILQPRSGAPRNAPWVVENNGAGVSVAGEALTYVTRERTTTIEPDTPACRYEPAMCRLD